MKKEKGFYRLLFKGHDTFTEEYNVREIRLTQDNRLAILCQRNGERSRIIRVPYHKVSIDYIAGLEEPSMTLKKSKSFSTWFGKLLPCAPDWDIPLILEARLRVPQNYKVLEQDLEPQR